MRLTGWSSGLLVLAAAFIIAGCGPKEATDSPKDGKQAKAKKPHDHGGWWCEEHGIPEFECSMCQDDVAKACKAKGDWCEKHPDRAKSQCFKCDPSLKEKFAAKYRAKYGEEPPPITEEEEAKKESKN